MFKESVTAGLEFTLATGLLNHGTYLIDLELINCLQNNMQILCIALALKFVRKSKGTVSKAPILFLTYI